MNMRVFAIFLLVAIAVFVVWERMSRRRRKVSMAKSRAKMYRQLDQAARNGDEKAMYRIAKLFYKERDAKYYPLIYKWVQILAAMKKDPAVWLELGDLLAGGYGTEQDLKRALQTYEQALTFDIAASKDSNLSLDGHIYLETKIIDLRQVLNLQH